MNTKYICAVIILLLINMATIAQNISGIVKDEYGTGMKNVTIALLRSADSSLIKYQVSDTSGNFIFTGQGAGSYLARASYTGHATQFSHVFALGNDNIVLPEMVLYKKAKTLQAITVNVEKPLIDRKVDRLIFNLQNSIAAKGTDLAEALKLAPLLKVTENGISIIGKGSVAIMINERIIHLDGADLISYLKSLRSDDVERIEIITNPPAKYEAQGNGGLINIVLKKNTSLGWSGNISTTYLQSYYPSLSNNFNLNYQSNKLSASLRLRNNNGRGKIDEESDVIGQQSILNAYPRTSKSHTEGANIGIDYKMSRKSNIGFIYDIGWSNTHTLSNNTTTYQTNGVTDSVLKTMSNNANPVFRQTLNVYHDLALDSLGKKISTVFNYFTNNPQTNKSFKTQSLNTGSAEDVVTNNDIQFKIWSVQTDVTLPYKWSHIEAGIKFTNFDNSTDVRYLNIVQQQPVPDSSKSNLFEYNEKNAAVYISAQRALNNKWTAKAGLRYEYTEFEGYSPAPGTSNRSQYGRLFPTAYLLYKMDEKNTFSINYSKRINRPNLNALNPFRFYTNPYSYYTGNPYLRPSFSHNIELSYLHGNELSFVLYGQKSTDGWGSVIDIENGNTVTTRKNFLTTYGVGFVGTFNKKIFSWWESSNSLVAGISSASSSLPGILVQDGYNLNYSTTNTFSLSKKLSTFVNFSHDLPNHSGNTYTPNQLNFRTGFRASLFGSKLQVNATYFRGSVYRIEQYFEKFTFKEFTDYKYNTLILNLTYKFGRPKVKGSTKNINFSEKQRAN
jgi:hypothetical protein